MWKLLTIWCDIKSSIIENQWDFSLSVVVWLLFVINCECYNQNRNQRGELKNWKCFFNCKQRSLCQTNINFFSDLHLSVKDSRKLKLEKKNLGRNQGKAKSTSFKLQWIRDDNLKVNCHSERIHDSAAGESQLFIKGLVQQVPSRQYGAGASTMYNFF